MLDVAARLRSATTLERDLVARLVGTGELSRAGLARCLEAASEREVPLLDALLATVSQAGAHLPAAQEAAREATSSTMERYILGGTVGRGGMGTIFRAYDPLLHRQVAIKSIRVERKNAQREVRFEREMGATAVLEHPGIVRVHAFGVHEESPFFVMDLVEGVSFDRWLAAKERDAAAIASVVRDVALAVDFLHGRSLVHRDLKPENVLVDAAGRARLVDFGIVHDEAADSLTGSGQILGTPLYMAPEQALDPRNVGSSTDVYGLGGLLYQALAGQPPNPTNLSLPELITWLRQGAPRPVLELAPDASPELAAIAMACLGRDPAKRPSARLVASDLERTLARRSGKSHGCAAGALVALAACVLWLRR
jgi:serine/threonine protein kinase